MGKLNRKQIRQLNKNRVVVLATADKRRRPHAIFVELNKATANQLIITDNEMQVTRQNILANGKVAVLAFAKDYSWCLKIDGIAKYYRQGKYFDFVRKLLINRGYTPKGAVVIRVRKIVETK